MRKIISNIVKFTGFAITMPALLLGIPGALFIFFGEAIREGEDCNERVRKSIEKDCNERNRAQ